MTECLKFYIGGEGKGLTAFGGQFLHQFLETLNAAGTEHNRCALSGQHPGGRLAQSAARARNHHDFTFDVFHI